MAYAIYFFIESASRNLSMTEDGTRVEHLIILPRSSLLMQLN